MRLKARSPDAISVRGPRPQGHLAQVARGMLQGVSYLDFVWQWENEELWV